MKIGVVADTHSKALPQKMIEDFRNVDLIVHVGDFCSLPDYEALAKVKKVKGVCGNMDDEGIGQRLPRRCLFNCEKVSVGLFHGEGPPDSVLEKAQKQFKSEKVDVVIFGHSHCAMNKKIGNVLYFNPGSPNDDFFAPYKSYGLLEISGDKVTGRIVKLEN